VIYKLFTVTINEMMEKEPAGYHTDYLFSTSNSLNSLSLEFIIQ